MSRAHAHDLWRRFLNPDYVGLLEALDFGRAFVRAEGARLWDESGREYTDFLAGFGVHNLGHNHPRLVAALGAALESRRPSMLNVDAPLEAGLLAERLAGLAGAGLCRTAFANSGAEAVEIAIQAARAATGRSALLSCDGAYHGLSAGALSLMGRAERRRPFEPLLAGCGQVPFGDAAALAAACRRLRPAAFFVEPVQGEGGVNVPPEPYLVEAAGICRRSACLLVLDEIQTGLGRTGAAFAADLREVRPDALLVGKALSGGMVPVAAAMLTAEVWERSFAGPERCRQHTSTFAGGLLAMVAGLETLAVLEAEGLAARTAELGAELLAGLKDLAGKHPVIREVRGRGLLLGVEFEPPGTLLGLALPGWARAGLYAQVVSAILLAEHGFLTQPCSLAPGVLRVEPPLVIGREDSARFLTALDRTLASCPSPGSAALAALRQRL